MLQQRLKLREKVGGEEVSVQDCLLLLQTEEFHWKPLNEVLQRLEARWLQASAAEKTWREHVKHPVYGSDAKVKRTKEAIKRIKNEYEAKFVGLQGQLQAAQAAATAAEAKAAAAATVRRVAAQAAAAGKAAAAEAAERSAELQHALQEQLDAARRGLSAVPLLREQLQMAQQAVEHVDQLWEEQKRNGTLQHALQEQLDAVKQVTEVKKMQSFKAWRATEGGGYFRAGIKEVAKKMPLEPQGRPSLYEQLCAVEHDFRWPDSERLAASYVQPRPVWETKRETQEKAAVAAAVARAAAEAADAKVAAEKAAAEAATEREFGVRPVWEFPPPGLRRDEYIFSLMIQDLL